MAFLTLYLLYVILVLILIIYLKLVFKCKRAVKISDNVKRHIEKNHKNSDQYLVQPPGPLPLPVIGNLALLGKYDVPFEGFSALSKIYGDVYSLTLGTIRCVVINNLETIKEVLNQNGAFFGGRPDFERFHRIFGGDRNNSLALCDWSTLQQKRRNLARKHCSPRNNSDYFEKLNEVGCSEVEKCIEHMKKMVQETAGEIHMKPLIMETCANLFLSYMCSTRFEYDDIDFKNMVRSFDEIFWEINQGYAVDFLPWLSPFYKKHMQTLDSWAKVIRKFILNRVIGNREEKIRMQNEIDDDFTDALLRSLAKEENVTKNTIIYMLEDFLGGHSAIGNLVYLSLGYIAKYPHIGHRIQEEIHAVSQNGKRKITLHDADDMPFTIATLFEILRHTSSPIVPHVATENSLINGYGIFKDTIVFINNYELNMSEKYWENPKEFNPERFLEYVPAHKVKKDAVPDSLMILRVKKNIPQFLPFSIGKRTCIGQNLVKSYSFLMLTNILENFDVTCENTENIKMFKACLAVPPETYSLKFTSR
ncbi:cytochrome P450 307a1-like [Chironomus tepperi]|uniref:cytochrome P450 307a1-like n=1 Tax=Chironomus tepperi TaxID=113505 RepID=UPI00391EED72